MNHDSKSGRIRVLIRRSENPYASLEYLTEPTPLQLYVKRLENPYASLSLQDEDVKSNTITKTTAINDTPKIEKMAIEKAAAKPPRETKTKADFEHECRQIFVHYIPETEKGRIRVHHRDFIRRNANSSPERRFKLLQQLKRYDLSSIRAIQPRFNREDDVFAEDKLRKIESIVDSLLD